MLDKIKALPEATRAKRVNIIKEIMSIILYFVMLNNPGKSGLIKLGMRIFGIGTEKFEELDSAMEEIEGESDGTQPSDGMY